MARLPPDALPLLQIIAASGQALSIEEASAAARQDGPAYATITRMRNERLVRLIGSQDEQLVDTWHDKIRETVLANLEKGQKQKLHHALGSTIEAISNVNFDSLLKSLDSDEGDLATMPARVVDLAYHFSEAGVNSRSLAYNLLAAESS